MNYSDPWYHHIKMGLSFLSHFKTFIFLLRYALTYMICPLYRSKLLVIGERKMGNWSELGASYVECKEKKLKSLLQWQSNAADRPPWSKELRSATGLEIISIREISEPLATHLCSSAIARRPNGRLCAFGRITRIPCHNPSALSLPMFSLPAPPPLTNLPPRIHPPTPPEIQVCQIWTDLGESTGSLSVKAASITEQQTLCLC